MARFLRLAFLLAFFVQIFVVDSQDFCDNKSERFEEELQQIKQQLQMQQQQLTFEKILKDQEDRLKKNSAELFASNEQKLNAILTKLTTLETEKQQKIENLSSQLEQAQKFNKNSTEKIQECKQIAEHQSFKIEENEMKFQKMNERLEQEVLRSSNISEQLQICNQNSTQQTEIIKELKIEKLKLEELLLQPCELFLNKSNTEQGIIKINLNDRGLEPFDVNCQRIDEEAWLIIQRRQDGSVDFYRNWTDYKNGFGDLDGEFWLGLEKVHQLTKNHEWELKIWLRDGKGKEGFARYQIFKVRSETEQYKLTVGEFSGNVEDNLVWLKGKKFSTPDRDNDEWSEGSCAIDEKGAWWFVCCASVYLNGDYNGNDEPNHKGIRWADFGEKLKYSQMAIRRLK